MNFLTRSCRNERRLGCVLVLWLVSFLVSVFAQNNLPVRSHDTPVLIWDIDVKLADALGLTAKKS
ncbi:MAG: hypothetical protein DMC59_05660 [Verrucomicrobia bacterium]|nr:MAG: hypothetical protein DMC59_05660 [Verrucomicrobiota bacterium]